MHECLVLKENLINMLFLTNANVQYHMNQWLIIFSSGILHTFSFIYSYYLSGLCQHRFSTHMFM